MSLSSRVLLALLLPGLLAVALPARAQDDGQVAILEAGPTLRKGIPFLGPNNLPAHLGTYRIADQTVQVLFTRQQLALPVEWPSSVCGSVPLLRVPSEEGEVWCHRQGGQFVLFFTFATVDAGIRCRFIEVFLQRFLYFLGVVENEVDVPFPAVLRLQE